jgi:hypothetical protein
VYEDTSSIRRGIVHLKPLPIPDHLSYELPEGHCCLISDDGTDLTVETLQNLSQRGWPVVVLSFPQQVVARRTALPEGTRVVRLAEMDETHLQACLDDAARLYGPVAVFIHLNPACADCVGDQITFSPTGRQILQQVFMTAKFLKESLNKAAQNGRAAFMAVVRLDGEFGLGERNDFDPVSGGLFGLVKSLNLEWESVFCRVLDLTPEMDAVEAAGLILAELDDPNRRLVEVGYSLNGRATLALMPATV